jgi:hypothetical protein
MGLFRAQAPPFRAGTVHGDPDGYADRNPSVLVILAALRLAPLPRRAGVRQRAPQHALADDPVGAGSGRHDPRPDDLGRRHHHHRGLVTQAVLGGAGGEGEPTRIQGQMAANRSWHAKAVLAMAGVRVVDVGAAPPGNRRLLECPGNALAA